jgi:hypothetical protein
VAFKIGNQTVIHDADATAAIETNSNLDRLQINGTDVLIHDGTTVTLKNVNINDLMEASINTDNVTEGTANLFYTTARQTAIENYSDQSELDAVLTANAYTDTREIATTTAYQTYADQAEADAVLTANAYTDTREVAITTALQSYADTAEADAVLTANAYTDTREVAITTALQSYADTAEADAKAYTDTEVATVLPLTGGTLTGALVLSGAPSSANHASTKAYVDSTISSGTGALDTDDIPEAGNLYYTDARVNSYLSTNNFSTQSYVDTAEADAIVSANTYTDTREVAITTAYQTYADTAEVDAKAYTDTRETAITTAYQTYADTAEVDAKAYTDTRETAITTAYRTYADQAETDAKAYTDIEVAAIVDGAPGTLDTLNELAAALGDDANLSTTLSTQIGTKLATADFNSTANTWLGSNLYYTDERVDDRVSNLLVAGSNITLTYNDSLNTMTIASATTASGGYDLSSNTTDDVTEGASNLYFTSARVNTIFNGKTTSDLTEGTNLYYTNARVDARIPTNVSSFTNDSGYLTSVGTISYNNLSNKPTIPTNNNQLTNGAGYITSFTDTNTTYTAGTGLTLTGTVFSNDITNNNQLTNGAGYITSFTDTNTTYTAGNGLTLTGTEFTMSGSYTGSFTATDDITAFSDERLKSNITTIEDALDKVKSMRGVMFDKTDSLTGELRQATGVIAQETEKVLPEVVHNDDNTGYKSVAYGNIVGVLIEAIKEQQLQIDELTEQVEFLTGRR